MPLDVVDLKQFYDSPLGGIARASILAGVRARWERLSGLAVAGLGYATPFLDDFRADAERCLALMPGRQGVMAWPPDGLAASGLVDPLDLPLRDSVIDRLLLVHALETSEDPAALLEEIWRVLAPGGAVIVIAPNRSGAWSRRDSTPFGHGQPFSRRQLTELLRHALFTPVHWSEALPFPPSTSSMTMRLAPVFERIGRFLGVPFGGVHLIEATKLIYRPVAARRGAKASSRLAPVLVPTARDSSNRKA